MRFCPMLFPLMGGFRGWEMGGFYIQGSAHGVCKNAIKIPQQGGIFIGVLPFTLAQGFFKVNGNAVFLQEVIHGFGNGVAGDGFYFAVVFVKFAF